MRGKPLTQRVGYVLVIGIAAKFFIDTSVQLFNPFLVMYAAGIGVSALTMGKLVSVRNLSGLAAPVIGSLADKYGYRRIMRLNLLLAGTGILLFALGKTMPMFIIAMIIWGTGQGGVGPNLHSYVSAMLPYSKRSRYLGTIEYSWALAGIIGLFFIGRIIAACGWRAPLFVLSAGMILSAFVMSTLPKNGTKMGSAPGHAADPDAEASGAKSPGSTKGTSVPEKNLLEESKVRADGRRADGRSAGGNLTRRIRSFFYLGIHQRSAWSCILISVFNYFATTHVMIIHGGWLEAEYGFGAKSLGTVALILGMFDWLGSIIVSVAGDNIGKKRSVLIGITGMMISFTMLPFFNTGIYRAVTGLALTRFFFEFATVSGFPLISEQDPSQRGKILSFSVTGGLVGTTLAAITGPAAYLKYGVAGLGPISAAAVCFSFVLLLLFVREEPHRRR